MKLKSIFFGIAITAVLLAMLVATRMMVLTVPSTEYEVRKIETVSLPEPPLPPAEEMHEDDIPPPPPPALANLSVIPNINQPAISVSLTKVDPKLAVETFFTDQAPAALPRPALPRSSVKAKGPSGPPSPPRPKVKLAPKQKSHYSLGELDQKPRLLRNPSVSFPRSIRNAKSGRVVVRVSILPTGRSRFLSVVSSTHPELIPLARRIANGSRFTPPTRQGKPVKAVMTWPITIKK